MIEETKLILEISKEIQADVKNCQKRLYSIEQMDAVQNSQLEEHMRRSVANEKRLEKIEDRQFKEKMVVGVVITSVVAIIEFLKGMM